MPEVRFGSRLQQALDANMAQGDESTWKDLELRVRQLMQSIIALRNDLPTNPEVAQLAVDGIIRHIGALKADFIQKAYETPGSARHQFYIACTSAAEADLRDIRAQIRALPKAS